MIRVTTLIENHGNAKKDLKGEHGLSMLVETDTENILFDTGQTGAFLYNAKRLGIDITRIDKVVLSHGHYDHTGGMIPYLRKIGHTVPIYVGKGFFERKYKRLDDGSFRYNGNPFTREELMDCGGQISEIAQQEIPLTKTIRLFRAFQSDYTFEAPDEAFCLKSGNGYIPDDFSEELAMAVQTKRGILVVIGCAHPGILGMLDRIRGFYQLPIAGIVGGSHLIHANEERFGKTVEGLRLLQPELLALSHCTGDENIVRMAETFGDRFCSGISGSVYELHSNVL